MDKKLACAGLIALVSTFGLSGCFAPLIIAGVAGAGAANVAGSNVPVSAQINDTKIKTQVISILNQMDAQLAYKSNVEVTVYDGIVLLLGQVPTKTIRHSIAQQTSVINGVKLVYNQLTVGPSVSFGTYSNDAWITTKVKANMVGTVDPLHFKVVTQRGVVYLMGQVTKVEGNLAATIARQTDGVDRVVEVFTYIAAPAVQNNPPADNPPSASASQSFAPQTDNSAPDDNNPAPVSSNNGAGSDASD
ncbi:MAG: BON domain-containing protein [Gammaproteobacteria bacterium]|nr:BON domain-containing protein [Gammaproteobacteria bacterium]